MDRDATDVPRWIGGRAGLGWGRLLVSFQRFAPPPGGLVHRAPRSLGALPVAAGPTSFVLPLGDEEAFWLGVLAPEGSHDEALELEVARPQGSRVAVARVETAGNTAIPGLARPDGLFDVFRRTTIVELTALHRGSTAVVRLCDPATYAGLTGAAPPPLDPSAGYGGWRLP